MIGNPLSLTAEQSAAMIGTANVFLTACPGSGKTRSIAGRVAWHLSEDRRLALLSHTNVGAEEIARAVTSSTGQTLPASSYVGTLHSFASRYILRPYGHLVTGASQPISVVDGAEDEEYRFSVTGDLLQTRSRISVPYAQALENRRESARRGEVGHDGALYWSLVTLQRFPTIARALAQRFSEIIVDEAQDSNELQLAILEVIRNAGLPSLVMVGDFDQSIYGFGGANPDLCRATAARCGLTTVPLNENHRSSQAICDVAAQFRSQRTPDRAVGPDKDFGLKPRVVRYPAGHPEAVIDYFKRRVTGIGGTADESVVVTRNNALATRLSGQPTGKLPSALRALLEAKRATPSVTMDLVSGIEDALLRASFGSAAAGLLMDSGVMRSAAMHLIGDLPDIAGNIATWAAAAESVLNFHASALSPATASPIELDVPRAMRGVSLDAQPAASNLFRVETVYKVKGESVDASMLVASEPTEDWHRSDAESWSAPLSLQASAASDEVRLCYVALTRARRLAVIALPDSTSSSLVERFVAAGFEEDPV